MSVTFSADNAPTAVEVYEDEDGSYIHEYGVLDVNMSNSNAMLVCESLGIDLEADGWCGGTSAEDFMGRVLMALAITPADEGMPSYEHVGPGARMIEGARAPGYVQARLNQLHELAQWAVAHDAEVSWA